MSERISTALKIWVVMFSAVFLVSCHSNSNKEQKNILFILIDDLGYKDLGCYGSEYYESPNIDKLAEEGFQFTNAYAAANVCSPSRASIMTGKYPARLGLTDWIPGRQANPNPEVHRCEDLHPKPFRQFLPLEEKTIAEVLKVNGYQTFFAGKWHLGDKAEQWPDKQGFDTNIGGFGQGYPNSYFSPYNIPTLTDKEEGENLTDRLTDETIDFLKKRNKSRPFFAFLSYYAVHNPLQAKEDLRKKYEVKAREMGLDSLQVFGYDKNWAEDDIACWKLKLRKIQSNATYAAMIETVDKNIGKLVQHLKEEELYDNTLIVFTSDNGGLSTAEGSNTSNLPLRAGKGWLYEGGTRVPLIIYNPGLSNFRTIDDPVIGTDFFPTLLEYCGIELSVENIDGVSLMSLIDNKYADITNEIKERALFWHYPHYSNQGPQIGGSVLKGGFKAIENFDTHEIELYDLSYDIREEKNVATEYPEKMKELGYLLKQWRASVNADIPE